MVHATLHKKYVRSNYRRSGEKIDYGDICGMHVGKLMGIVDDGAGFWYTAMSASATEGGLGAGFQGSILLFLHQIVGPKASVPSFSQKLARLTPLISGVTYLGFYGFWLSKADSVMDSMAADSVSFKFTIFVVSR